MSDLEYFAHIQSKILSEPKIGQTLLVCWKKGINLTGLIKILIDKKMIEFSDIVKIPDEIYIDNNEIHDALITAISDAMETYIIYKKPSDIDSFSQEILLIEKKLPDLDKMNRIIERMMKKAKSFSNWYEIYIRSKTLPNEKRVIIEKMREFASNYQEYINLFDISKNYEEFDKALSCSSKIEEYIELFEKAFDDKYRQIILEKIDRINNTFSFWNNCHSKNQNSTGLSELLLNKMLLTAKSFEEWQLMYQLGNNKIKQKAIDEMAKL